MSKLQITKISLDVELSDKTYGNGTASRMFLSAEPAVEKLTTKDAPTIIDQGLDLFMIAVETLMAGRLAVESITDEQYKSFIETATRRLKEIRAMLPSKQITPLIPTGLEALTSSAVEIPSLTLNTATVPAQTEPVENSHFEIVAEREAIQSERFYVKNGSTNNAERLLALENWAYDGPPKDTTREFQLVKYALFLVPTYAPVDIEKNGRLDIGKFKAAFITYSPEERSDRITLVEDLAATSTPETFRAWAQTTIESVWK